jgi:hypothetical protein
MADREVHTTTTTGGSSGIGILGVIVGAVLVLGAIFFFAGGADWFDNGGGTQVTVKQGSGLSSPAQPTSPGSTTGSAPSNSAAPAASGSAPKQ